MHARGPRVLLTDGHTNAALAVVRSLGRSGCRVTVVQEHGRVKLAGASRYADRVVRAPRASRRPGDYTNVLLAELGRFRYDILLPVADTSVVIVDKEREAFDALAMVALPTRARLRQALDKKATIDLAREVGVRVPATRIFDSVEEAGQHAHALRYPCIIKPRFSRHWSGEGPMLEGPVRFVRSPKHFLSAYPELHRSDAAPVVQEYVKGVGVGVFALVEAGKLRATFVHRRLRETNPVGGPSSLAESLPLDERLVAPARQLLHRAEWNGVAMVEFKDPENGEAPVLMEINGRFWGSLPLAIAAGVDFPYLLAQSLLGQKLVEPQSYQVGLRCRHLRGDLSHLAGVFKGPPAGWPVRFPGRWSTLAAIAPLPGRWTPYNMRLSDPLPALVECWSYIRDELRTPLAGDHMPSCGHARDS